MATHPGHIAFTSMTSLFKRHASFLVKPLSAALDILYAGTPWGLTPKPFWGSPKDPAPLDTLTILPCVLFLKRYVLGLKNYW